MGWQATVRALEAAERRQQREAQKRFRELQRQAKEQAKLSALEQARLEVETYNNRLEVLRSVHIDQGETWDWTGIAASLPPPIPRRNAYYEFKINQQIQVLAIHQRANVEQALEQARLQDEQTFQEALKHYQTQLEKWQKMRVLAHRILAGEHKAYIEALTELNPFGEISELGSTIHFTIHTSRLIECGLKVTGKQAIPREVKMLTANGKLSTKPMPIGSFHEIYQDHVCGCVLRIAREIFALLPVRAVLITASADLLDSRTGRTIESPVLSVVIPKIKLSQLDLNHLDPSDAMENFQYRGHFKATRKSETFQPISPLTLTDIAHDSIEEMGVESLLSQVKRQREEIKLMSADLDRSLNETVSQNNP